MIASMVDGESRAGSLHGWDAAGSGGGGSAFAAASTAWGLGTSPDPRAIELEAAVDNKEGPEDLPLAPWS